MKHAGNARPLPGQRRQHADDDDHRHGNLDQPAIIARGPRRDMFLLFRLPCGMQGLFVLVAEGRLPVARLPAAVRLGAQIVGVAFGGVVVQRMRFVFFIRRRVWRRRIGVADVARRLRGFGGCAAEIVHLAHHVAEALDAVAFDRRCLRARVQQPLARARLGRAARRCRFGRRAGYGFRRGRLGTPRLDASAIGGRTVAARQRRGGSALLGARLARRIGLDLADRVFQREAFFGDFRFRQRRVDAAQLRHQRGPRPFIKRPSSFPRAAVKTFHRAGDERMIVGHHLSLRSPL